MSGARNRPPEPPVSPCVRVCVMDADDRYCAGCRRTRAEIAAWWTLTDEQKRTVLAALPARAAAPPAHGGR